VKRLHDCPGKSLKSARSVEPSNDTSRPLHCPSVKAFIKEQEINMGSSIDGSVGWWLAAGLMVALELLSGTFYLLMLALGCAAAGLAAYAGWSATAQTILAAGIGGSAVLVWHQLQRLYRLQRLHRRHPPGADLNNLDIGQHVQVDQWQSDGTARVHYRGTLWSARYQGDAAPAPGAHVIQALDGNTLILEPQH
jgi:membrane protein implicated in regulation of membrane protease activity